MATLNQASFPQVLDAGQVRLAELGARVVYLRQNYQAHPQETRSIIDLRLGLEQMARATTDDEREAISAYLQETYGLLVVYTDPLLRPSLPPIPANGATIRPLVLRIQGDKVLRIQGNKVLGLGYRLVPNVTPTYNTSLAPTQAVASVAYNGLLGTVLSFDGPVPTTASTGRFLRLYVGGVQVGRIDFPSTLDGQGFSLLYNGALYYNTFQAASTNELALY